MFIFVNLFSFIFAVVLMAERPKSPPRLPLFDSSYANAKNLGLPPLYLPSEVQYSTTYARHDFFNDGSVALFATKMNYDPRKSAQEVVPDDFIFWKLNAANRYVRDHTLLQNSKGCVHSRKALVADFNGDHRPDIVVLCHGHDSKPFPGESLWIVLSSPSGSYHVKQDPKIHGFFHGGAAADLNNDRAIDLIIGDFHSGESLRMLLNNGDGTFKEVRGQFPSSLRRHNFTTVEITDVDGDGHLDVLAAGNDLEPNSDAYLIKGKGSFGFNDSEILLLPKAEGLSVVLDFLVLGNDLFLNRTSGRRESYYQRKAVQRINLETLESTVLASEASQWYPWLIPSQNGVQSDNLRRIFAVPR